jgi:cholesterol transport system auxiliary component
MITVRKTASLAAGLALALAMGGCVTLFPKAKPVQLYRFGEDAAVSPGVAGGAPLIVLYAPTSFTAAAAGDRILTATGRQTAYISDARWVSAAAVLFDEAETRALSTPGGGVQLLRRGQAATAPLSLRLDVETFEARYDDGPGAAPTVVVTVAGELTRLTDRKIVGARTFEVRKPAAGNRVGAIVEAFDGATADVLGQVAAWTAQQGGAR